MVPHLSYPTDHGGPSSVPRYMEIHQIPIPSSPSSHPSTTYIQMFPSAPHSLTLGPQSHAGALIPHLDERSSLSFFSDGPQHLPSPVFPDVPYFISALAPIQDAQLLTVLGICYQKSKLPSINCLATTTGYQVLLWDTGHLSHTALPG